MTSLNEDILARAMGANRGHDQTKIICPSCSSTRKPIHQRDAVLSIHYETDRILYNCWHCDIKGSIPMTTPTAPKPRSVVPLRPPEPLKVAPATASDDALAWLETERGIPRELAEAMGVVSASRWIRNQANPSPCVGFTYRTSGQTYAIKWRSYPTKGWTQDGAAQTLYLADTVPIGEDLVICEGEMDALSFHAAGIPACSIPSGGIDTGTRDDGAKLRWMSSHDDLLSKAGRICLAVDADEVGEKTAQELARRLGKARCYRVSYPPGCKDTNDVLVKHGPDAVRTLLTAATPWPVEGIKSVTELADQVLQLYSQGLPPGLSTGWAGVDPLFTVSPGNLIVVTGLPSSGKSAWLDNLLMNMMLRHGYRVAFASFENPTDVHLSKLLSLWRLEPFGKGRTERMSEATVREGLAWLQDRVSFLELEEEVPTVDGLLARFDVCIRRFGTKACVVDPFNFIKLAGEGGTEEINRMLAAFKVFARTREVAFFIVAHPAKPFGNPGDWVPTGYSIAGSAHWYNRADFGLTVARRPQHVELHVWKARFQHQGKQGVANLVFDPITAAYEEQRVTSTSFRPHWTDPF